MSKQGMENLAGLMRAAVEDEQLAATLQAARSFERVKELALGHGFPLGALTAEQARRTIGVLTGRITSELTEDELALVAGGTDNRTLPKDGKASVSLGELVWTDLTDED